MSDESKTSEYILLFRGVDWYKYLPPDETQAIADRWMAWFKRLMDEGRAVAGSPLEPQGRVISASKSKVVSDGPFTESKETIGGYFLLKVKGEAEAVAIAKECPGLPYGAVVEARPLAPTCRLSDEAVSSVQLAQATA